MLPYGTLWRLDQMLHPANPPRRRTAALRRRQALVYFLWGVCLVSIFLVPFHYASLRRMRIDAERESLGLVAPTVDLEQLHLQQDQALQRLRLWAAENRIGKDPKTHGYNASDDALITADFALVFYLHPSSRTRLDGVFAHPYVQALAGGGVGVLWPQLGDATSARNASGPPGELQNLLRAPTLSEVAAKAAKDASKPAKCLIALRRDLLPVEVNGTKDGGTDDVIRALREALSTEKGLGRFDVGESSNAGKVEAAIGDVRAATERKLAALLLWLTSRQACSDAQEEALSRVLASCQAPLSRSMHTSFDWRTTPEPSLSAVTIAATLRETETALQYLCLCSKHGVQPPAALVERSSGATTPLFLVDPAQLATGMQTCTEACVFGGQRTVGDWQERRQRRHGGPILDSPQAHLPEPVDTTESISRGFLPSGFHDRVPKSTYPASDGPETRPRPSQYTPLEQQTLGRFITSTWVVVSGVPADDILDVRDYFDAYVGCTVAHHLPLAASTQSEMYVQFASSLDAAQAVRTGVYSFNVEIGTAAAHPRSFAATNDIPARQLRSLELTVGWCRDLVFLESRERLRRQLLEAGPRSQRRAVLEPVSSVGKAPGTNELSGTPSPASPSLESSARGSDAAAATDGEDNNNAAAHPLLPRHRGRPSGSPSDSFSSTVTGPSSSRFAASASAQAGAAVSTNPSSPVPPPAWDLASNYPHSGAYHYAEQPFSDSHYSSLMRGGRQRSTVLSLFFHPCSCSPGAQWTIFFYVPVRFALLLLWTAWNAVSQLLSSPSAVLSHRRQPSLRQHNATHGDTAPAVPTQSLLPSPSQWRLRRSLRVGDVVPYAASPFEYISFLFYKYIPFAPEPQEVDVVLWSWLVLHSPRPQQSLRQLKQSVMVRQRPMNAMAGRFPTDNSLHVAATDLNQWGTQALGKTHRELPVLLAWRPAWWFTRYSPLSLFIMLVMFYYYY